MHLRIRALDDTAFFRVRLEALAFVILALGCGNASEEKGVFPITQDGKIAFIDGKGDVIHQGFDIATSHGTDPHFAIKNQQLYKVLPTSIVPVATLSRKDFTDLWSLGEGVVIIAFNVKGQGGRLPRDQVVIDTEARFKPPKNAIFLRQGMQVEPRFHSNHVIYAVENEFGFLETGVLNRDGKIVIEAGQVKPKWVGESYVSGWQNGPDTGFGYIDLRTHEVVDSVNWAFFEQRGLLGSGITNSGFYIAVKDKNQPRGFQFKLFDPTFSEIITLDGSVRLIGDLDYGFVVYEKSVLDNGDPTKEIVEWGLCSKEGTLNPIFQGESVIRPVSDGVRVFRSGGYGILAPDGRLIKRFGGLALSEVGDFHNGLALAKGSDEDGRWTGYIDKQGTRIYTWRTEHR